MKFGTPHFGTQPFLKIVSTSYRIDKILLKRVGSEAWGPVFDSYNMDTKKHTHMDFTYELHIFYKNLKISKFPKPRNLIISKYYNRKVSKFKSLNISKCQNLKLPQSQTLKSQNLKFSKSRFFEISKSQHLKISKLQHRNISKYKNLNI